MMASGTARKLAVAGSVALAAWLVLTFAHWDGGTVAQWNGLCHGVIGQIGQAFNSRAARDCTLVGDADTVKGWLLVLGAAALAVSALSRSIPRMPTPGMEIGPDTPPGPTSAPAPPPPPTAAPAPAHPQPTKIATSGRQRIIWNKLTWPLTAVAVAAILATSAVLAARALRPAAPSLPVLTVGNWTGTNPSFIGFSGDGSNVVARITWSSWTLTAAEGIGTSYLESCVPNCAQGTTTAVPADITLSDPVNGRFTVIKERRAGATTTFTYPGTWPGDAS
jgi:hypothetical protein